MTREALEPLAVLSHEVRTPLKAVLGLARALLHTNLDARQREIAETLEANAGLLLNLVSDMLDWQRLRAETLKLEARPFRFAFLLQVLRNLFHHTAAEKGLKLVLVDKTDERLLVGDVMRLQQILGNLVGNALKFTDEGVIEVTGTLSDDPERSLVVEVRDTGRGIAAEKLVTIFEPFVQLDADSREGAGLGLAISHDIARRMGGSLTVTSMEGEGSCFTVSVPIRLGDEASDRVEPARTTGTVLVVDDYPANVLVLTLTLENLGYDVEIARSGLEAMRMIVPKLFSYAAVLMDVHLPDMSGMDATRGLRSLGFGGPILGVTAHVSAEEYEACLEAGMDEVLEKPIEPELLRDAITMPDASPARRSASC